MRVYLLVLCFAITTIKSTFAQATLTNAAISFEFVSKGVKGTISGFQSNSSIDLNNFENSLFEGSVAVKTLNTNNRLRNWHLKNGKYFDADTYPKITFKSKSVRSTTNGYIVSGDLTLKGITKPLEIVFTKKENLLEGNASLYSSDFNIKIKKNRDDNLVKLNLRLQL